MSLRDIHCDGACEHKSPVECAWSTAIVFPYRGLFMRHVGQEDAIGEANQLLFFNRHQEYSISHPVAGGDACLSLAIQDETLRDLVPRSTLDPGPEVIFRRQRIRINPIAQSISAWLRHGLRSGVIDPLQAESLVLNLVTEALHDGETQNDRVSAGKHKLIDRAKLALHSDLGRRWTLAEIGKEVGCSPVYLTQVFQQVEGVPLYRYQLRLRLAKALDDIPLYDDLTMLALDLGFSSHSHFTSAFRAAYGQSPSAFRKKVRPAAFR